jgi:predicted lipopolysaccharide heptosyltransferase III
MGIDLATVKRMLVINLASIGDVLLCTPAVRALRQASPTAVIDMLVVPWAAPIARGNPYIDQAWEYDKSGVHNKLGQLHKLVRFIRGQHYDLAIATNFATRGAVVAWLSGIRWRVGYDAQHAARFLTHAVSSKRPLVRHEAEYSLDVLKPLGISTDDTSLALNVCPRDTNAMKQKITRDSAKPLVALCPASEDPHKDWTVASFAELIRRIAPLADCYLIGSGRQDAKLAEINEAAGKLARILAGTLTLGELAALIAEAKLLVTVDTGPLHIANAVTTPVVALFGPTDPRNWGPRGPRDVVFRRPVDCSPCWCKVKCDDRKCMTEISPSEVAESVLLILSEQ